MSDIHRFERRYELGLVRLMKGPLAQEDKESIEQFLIHMRSKSTGWARLGKLCQMIHHLGELLGKTFEQATEADIRRIVTQYENGDYSFWARHDVRVVFKQYYAWLNGGKYPPKVDWICTNIPHREKRVIKESELLTPDEISKVIDAADSPRNKALIAVLAESGARIGEIGNLDFGQVAVDPNGVVLNLYGKTGHRRIRIVNATPYLINWMNAHPMRNNPSTPLWPNVGARAYHKRMSYEAVRKVMVVTFKKAGIPKRCNPYVFRHTRACQLANHMTEFQMNSYFGWVQGSYMAATYVHISGRDLDNHILKLNGIKPSETAMTAKPENRTCSRCQTINPANALYCGKCAEIVDPSLALKTQMQELEKPVQQAKSPFLEWLQTDAELRQLLKKKVAEFKESS
ncbi:tyrosine-type recombinase/integrase [Candidatus Woesearchaeota archaeon]|nr:tyrosine-type recombinase/integrase [Candidatus Woesearchaeota archaeon]